MTFYLTTRQLKKIPTCIPEYVETLYLYDNQITKISGENIPQHVKELYLDENQVMKIRNLPKHITFLSLYNNPCYDITKNMYLEDIIWMSNFSLPVHILNSDIKSIIYNYCIYGCFKDDSSITIKNRYCSTVYIKKILNKITSVFNYLLQK